MRKLPAINTDLKGLHIIIEVSQTVFSIGFLTFCCFVNKVILIQVESYSFLGYWAKKGSANIRDR